MQQKTADWSASFIVVSRPFLDHQILAPWHRFHLIAQASQILGGGARSQKQGRSVPDHRIVSKCKRTSTVRKVTSLQEDFPKQIWRLRFLSCVEACLWERDLSVCVHPFDISKAESCNVERWESPKAASSPYWFFAFLDLLSQNISKSGWPYHKKQNVMIPFKKWIRILDKQSLSISFETSKTTSSNL